MRIVEVLGGEVGRVFGVGACLPSCGSGALVYLHLVGREGGLRGSWAGVWVYLNPKPGGCFVLNK